MTNLYTVGEGTGLSITFSFDDLRSVGIRMKKVVAPIDNPETYIPMLTILLKEGQPWNTDVNAQEEYLKVLKEWRDYTTVCGKFL